MTQSQPQLTQEQQVKLKEALEFSQAAEQNLKNADAALNRLQQKLGQSLVKPNTFTQS